ncbi:polymerase [Novosphingobium sp. AAP83]|uniref:putative O-glycosylation ligase, exosortase A system-associated n=1 Tax=Novosphingobium sp. AAP83 TaxID=1523425 RepID=UPI0006B9C6B9|nr:putative O-glycosylation ligase, exosortase A system-associated [Novosphingobium sp. AAP83]KPF94041.1 polymerase [Novosphingobium sp. AAP83]
MLDLFLLSCVLAFIGAGFRKPFIFVLAYTYIDIVSPQKVSWGILSQIPISLIAFLCAFTAWFVAEDKNGTRFSLRQFLLLLMLVYCGLTTQAADFPLEAGEKWAWVWKALLFALFLPLTLRTRLRIEALTLVMVLSIGVIVIGGGIKTLAGGGGYGELRLLVDNNTGLYEGSIISAVAVAVIPLALWASRFGTIFPPEWRVKAFAWALCFACALMPIGTGARTGLVCVVVLAALVLRTAKRKALIISLMAAGALVAIPLLPAEFVARMGTINNHQSDQSASTRVAVWRWTLEFVKDRPFGGGFDAYRQNRISYDTVEAKSAGDNNTALEYKPVVDQARAYHSSYFEMLGEQGYPGLALWLALHLLGVWQMEVLRRRYRKETSEAFRWVSPLAEALQQAQIIYLVGSTFVGIAFQPFCYMLVGLQCGLWGYIKRVSTAKPVPFRKASTPPLVAEPGRGMATAQV